MAQEQNTTKLHFSTVLREKMKQQGITQVALAAKLGVTQAAVSEFVNGRIPNGERFVRLAQVLGTTAEALLGIEVPAGQRPQHVIADLPPSALSAAEEADGLDFHLYGPESFAARKRYEKAIEAHKDSRAELQAAVEEYRPFFEKDQAIMEGYKKADEEKAKKRQK